jgi:hypothetical protein
MAKTNAPKKPKKTSQSQASVKEPQQKIPAAAGRKRLLVPASDPVLRSRKKCAELFRQTKQKNFDAIVFPFTVPEGVIEEAKSAGLAVEAGGWAMSLLVPRQLFFFHREIFRMEAGKRRSKIHFCPTNPETIAVIRNEVKKIPCLKKVDVVHLWPEKGSETTWCACPTCRAFTLSEQYRIAVNAAADALAEISPAAFISIHETSDEVGDIPLRPNIFSINPEKIEVSS